MRRRILIVERVLTSGRLLSLALCEIYFAVAALAIRVLPHMTLFETTEDDVLYDHDMFIPMVKAGSKGIRVTVS